MFLSRILGFFRNTAIAALFGQNNITDAYNTAYLLPDTLYLILIGGGVSSAFIPVLARYIRENQEDEGWRVISIAFSITLIGMSIVILLGFVFAPAVVKILAPWFSPAKLALTVALTRVTILAILFHSLNGVLIGTEYAYNSFWATSIGPLIYNATIVAAGVLLAPSMGIFSFAWATVIGAFLNFLVQLWGTFRLKPKFAFSLNIHHPGLKRVGSLMLPATIGLSIAQLNLVFNQAFLASRLQGGAINALSISSRVMLVPVLVATSIGITLLPSLAQRAADDDLRAYKTYVRKALRAVVFVSLPSAVGIMLLAHPIVRILFQHGRFSGTASDVTAATLYFYSVGILAYGAYEILSRAFWALGDTKTPLLAGLFSIGLGIGLNLLLISLLTYRGLALAYSLTGFLNAITLLYLLRRRVGALGWRDIAGAFARTAGATAVMAVVLLATRSYLTEHLLRGAGLMGGLVQLLSPLVLGLLVFLLAAWLLKLPEVSLVVGVLRRRLPSRVRAEGA